MFFLSEPTPGPAPSRRITMGKSCCSLRSCLERICAFFCTFFRCRSCIKDKPNKKEAHRLVDMEAHRFVDRAGATLDEATSQVAFKHLSSETRGHVVEYLKELGSDMYGKYVEMDQFESDQAQERAALDFMTDHFCIAFPVVPPKLRESGRKKLLEETAKAKFAKFQGHPKIQGGILWRLAKQELPDVLGMYLKECLGEERLKAFETAYGGPYNPADFSTKKGKLVEIFHLWSVGIQKPTATEEGFS